MVEMIQNLFNGIMDVVNGMGDAVSSTLPPSPFAYYKALDNDILKAINWLIPIGEMIAVLEGWLVCIAIWYAARVFMRWLKAAGG